MWLVMQKLTLVICLVARKTTHRYLLVVAFTNVRSVLDLANFFSFFVEAENFAVVKTIFPFLLEFDLPVFMVRDTLAVCFPFLSILPLSFPDFCVLIDPTALTVWLVIFQLAFIINCFDNTCVIASHFHKAFPCFFYATFSFAINELTLECQLSRLAELANFTVVETIFELLFTLQLADLVIREKLAVSFPI